MRRVEDRSQQFGERLPLEDRGTCMTLELGAPCQFT
jgi:hypothetical protein